MKVRVAVTPSDASGMVSLNLSYDGPFNDIGFTLTAYSGFGMRWVGPLRALPFDLRISGALTTKTSGGNYTLSTYMINPQYRLRVPGTTQDGPSTKTRVEILLHAPRDVPINAIITWGRGQRVFE
jgi:calpain-7